MYSIHTVNKVEIKTLKSFLKKNLIYLMIIVTICEKLYQTDKLLVGDVNSVNRFIITWILPQLFMYSDKVVLEAGKSNNTTGWTN